MLSKQEFESGQLRNGRFVSDVSSKQERVDARGNTEIMVTRRP